MATSLDTDPRAARASAPGLLHQSALALMIDLGHRTGLFDTLARLAGRATAHRIAFAAGLDERHVREWLGVMVRGGVVEYDPATRTYRLSPQRAAATEPRDMGASGRWVAAVDLDELERAFADQSQP